MVPASKSSGTDSTSSPFPSLPGDLNLKQRTQSTRFLKEEPAEKSDYDAHQKIANAIYDAVTLDEESQSIALTGPLGSGKSTIIRIIQKHIGDSRQRDDARDASAPHKKAQDRRSDNGRPPVILFSFDAWTHTGDSIRRSFIQELIMEMRESVEDGEIELPEPSKELGYIHRYSKKLRAFIHRDVDTPDQPWKDAFEGVVKRKTETTQQTQTTVGVKGQIAALSALFFTSGMTLFGRSTVFPDMIPVVGGSPVSAFGYACVIISLFLVVLLLIPRSWRYVSLVSASISALFFSLANVILDPDIVRTLFSIGGAPELSWMFSLEAFSAWTLAIIIPLTLYLVVAAGPESVSDESAASGFIQRTAKTSTLQQSDREQPSTHDFRDAIKNVLGDVLRHNEESRLVIVIDNIDRLESKEEVKSAWRTLQILFDIRDYRKAPKSEEDDWKKRLWILAPFSEKQVSNAYAETERLPAHFVDKPFQVKHVIPSPSYLRWRNFISRRFVEAFQLQEYVGGNEEKGIDAPDSELTWKDSAHADSFNCTIRLASHYFSKVGTRTGSRSGGIRSPEEPDPTGLSRTPRDAKRFVNDVVMSYRIHGCEKIPFGAHVLYALELRFQGNLPPVTEISRDSSIPLGLASHILCDETGGSEDLLLQSLYALDYGVQLERANEYILSATLSDALTRTDGYDIDELNDLIDQSDLSTSEIDDLIQDTLQSSIVGTAVHPVARQARVLTELNVDLDHLKVRKELVVALSAVKAWPLREEVASDLAAFLKSIRSNERSELAKGVFEALSTSIDQQHNERKPDESKEFEEVLQEWVSFVISVTNCFDDPGEAEEVLGNNLRVPGSTVDYLQAACKLYHHLTEYTDISVDVAASAFTSSHRDLGQNEVRRKIESHIVSLFEDSLEERAYQLFGVLQFISDHSSSIDDWPLLKYASSIRDQIGQSNYSAMPLQGCTLTLALARVGLFGTIIDTIKARTMRALLEVVDDAKLLAAAVLAAALMGIPRPFGTKSKLVKGRTLQTLTTDPSAFPEVVDDIKALVEALEIREAQINQGGTVFHNSSLMDEVFQ